MSRSIKKTTALPRQLREELGLPDRYGAKNRRFNKGPASRKERRKEERKGTKGYTRKLVNGWNLKHNDDDDDDGDEDEGESQIDLDAPSDVDNETPKKQPKSILKKSKTTHDNEDSDPKLVRKISKGVQERLGQDDAEIAALEKRLGIKNWTKLPKAFEEDGLADVFGDLSENSEVDSNKRKREGDEWLQRKRRKAQGLLDDEDEDEDEDESDESSEDEDKLAIFDDDDEEDEEEHETGKAKTKKPDKVRENPYVAPATNGDNNRPKYIPPSLRASAGTDSEDKIRLRRQAQGLLNKLSEANLISILGQVEKLYRENPRQHVTSALTSLLLGLVTDRSVLQDTFIILHAGFIAAIYKIIGMDFGAEIIQRLVETYDQTGDQKGTFDGKEPINLMSLLSQLYNFQVVGSNLVFDYIRLFLQEITETNTELLLKIIRNSGPQLRQDDPSALKDIVLLIQPAVTQVGGSALSVRTKFMIETITDLKNNRMKTGIAASSIVSEHITKMRKILGSLNSRNVRATEPIRVSRADIYNSAKKGKWWLVGASWKDDPLEFARQELSALPSAATQKSTQRISDSDGEPDLVSIAKAHRMNTDVRRSIFVAMMSATNYRDAHVRLSKLHLKRNQEYEIPRVLVHCAMEEEAHNPYYTLIARRICNESGRRMKMSFTFTLWDVFKRMGERSDLDDDDDDDANDESIFNGFDDDDENSQKLSMKSIVNLAKLYGGLIADTSSSLNLAILKNLNFAYLQPKTSTFVEVLIITILQHHTSQSKARSTAKSTTKTKSDDGHEDNDKSNAKALTRIFAQTHTTAPYIVKGLTYFIRKVVVKTDIVASAKEKKLVKWGCRVAVYALKGADGDGDGDVR